MTDPLVGAAAAGDRRALSELLEAHVDRIHAVCRSMCRDPGDAEDATQEALLAIARGIERFDGRSSFSTWTHRIAVNAAIDELRRRRRRPDLIDPRHADAGMGASPDSADPGAADDPADRAVGADVRRTLRSAIDELPEEFRVPVLLRDVADLDYAEIAAVLDIAPGTVRSRIARGRARLAEALRAAEAPGNRTPGALVQTHESDSQEP